MPGRSYHQFCPTAMAWDLLEPRWTMLMLAEIGGGGTSRFSDIQRGVPGMSPTLLSRRLREMDARGLIRREAVPETGQWRYLPTEMTEALLPLIDALGDWAHRFLDPDLQLEGLDDRLLMWNIRRKVRGSALPQRRCVVRFRLTQGTEPVKNYWLITRPEVETDLCSIDPQFDVDLSITADLRALTSAWMGHSRIAAEIDAGRILLVGDREIAATITDWLVRSRFARDPGRRCTPAPEVRASCVEANSALKVNASCAANAASSSGPNARSSCNATHFIRRPRSGIPSR